MKKFMIEFLKRGLMAAAGGPVILAIIYACLGSAGVVEALTPAEVCRGILSVTLMAFIAAGITGIYTQEQLPLVSAIFLHGGVLYLDYLIMYLLNDWIPGDPTSLGVFTAIFVAGYALVWLCIYWITKANAKQLTGKLNTEK